MNLGATERVKRFAGHALSHPDWRHPSLLSFWSSQCDSQPGKLHYLKLGEQSYMGRSVVSMPISFSWVNGKQHSAIPSSIEVAINKYIKSQRTVSALVSVWSLVWQLKWLCGASYGASQSARGPLATPGSVHSLSCEGSDGISKLISSKELRQPIWGCKIKEIWNLEHLLCKFIFALNKQ